MHTKQECVCVSASPGHSLQVPGVWGWGSFYLSASHRLGAAVELSLTPPLWEKPVLAGDNGIQHGRRLWSTQDHILRKKKKIKIKFLNMMRRRRNVWAHLCPMLTRKKPWRQKMWNTIQNSSDKVSVKDTDDTRVCGLNKMTSAGLLVSKIWAVPLVPMCSAVTVEIIVTWESFTVMNSYYTVLTVTVWQYCRHPVGVSGIGAELVFTNHSVLTQQF